MQLTKTIMALAALVFVVQATPVAPQTLDLRAAEAALHNPDNLSTVWVLDECNDKVCDLTKGHLEIAEQFNGRRSLSDRSPNPDLDFTLKAREGEAFRDVCSKAHQAASYACGQLINLIGASHVTISANVTRSICRSGCCVSWSANATFNSGDLASNASSCYNACATAEVSCQALNATLGGRVLDVCVSNRPDGCT